MNNEEHKTGIIQVNQDSFSGELNRKHSEKENTLRDYPILLTILGNVYNREFTRFKIHLNNLYRANDVDAEDAINETFIKLCKLKPERDIRDALDTIIRDSITSIAPEIKDKIVSAFTALFFYYLKLTFKETHFCKVYHEITRTGIKLLMKIPDNEKIANLLDKTKYILTQESIRQNKFPDELKRIRNIKYNGEKEYVKALDQELGDKLTEPLKKQLLFAGKIQNRKIYRESVFEDLMESLIGSHNFREHESSIVSVFRQKINGKGILKLWDETVYQEDEMDEPEFDTWYQLCKDAGLEKKETEFVLFRLENPYTRDQSFHKNLTPSEISRIKSSAKRKLTEFLYRD